MGSYSATKRNIPFVDGSALTPNAEINTADNTWIWIGKVVRLRTRFPGAFSRRQLQRAKRHTSRAPGADYLRRQAARLQTWS